MHLPPQLAEPELRGFDLRGSLYAAVDPIYMIQLIYVLGEEYVVWDKAAEIRQGSGA